MGVNFNPEYTAITANSTDDLLAGDNVGPVTEGRVTVLSGQNLVRGTLLGRITASGKYVKSLSASSDGSQVPAAILANDTDASAADVGHVLIYTSGEFNERRVIFGTAHTADTTRDALRARGIHLKDSVPA
jgi:hypothetical protein